MFLKLLALSGLLCVSTMGKELPDVDSLILDGGDPFSSLKALGNAEDLEDKATRDEFANAPELPEDAKAEMDGIKASMDIIEEDLAAFEELLYALRIAKASGKGSVSLPEKFMHIESFAISDIAQLADGAIESLKGLIEQTQDAIDDTLNSLRTSGPIISQPGLIGSLEVAKAYLDTRLADIAMYRAQFAQFRQEEETQVLEESSGSEQLTGDDYDNTEQEEEESSTYSEQMESSGQVELTEDENTLVEEEYGTSGAGVESSGNEGLEEAMEEEETDSMGSGAGLIEQEEGQEEESEASDDISQLTGSLEDLNGLLESLVPEQTDDSAPNPYSSVVQQMALAEAQSTFKKMVKRALGDAPQDADAPSAQVYDPQGFPFLISPLGGDPITNLPSYPTIDAGSASPNEETGEIGVDSSGWNIFNVPSPAVDQPASQNVQVAEGSSASPDTDYTTTLLEKWPEGMSREELELHANHAYNNELLAREEAQTTTEPITTTQVFEDVFATDYAPYEDGEKNDASVSEDNLDEDGGNQDTNTGGGEDPLMSMGESEEQQVGDSEDGYTEEGIEGEEEEEMQEMEEELQELDEEEEQDLEGALEGDDIKEGEEDSDEVLEEDEEEEIEEMTEEFDEEIEEEVDEEISEGVDGSDEILEEEEEQEIEEDEESDELDKEAVGPIDVVVVEDQENNDSEQSAIVFEPSGESTPWSKDEDEELLALKIALPVVAFFIVLALIAMVAFGRRRKSHTAFRGYFPRSTYPYASYKDDVEAYSPPTCRKGMYVVEA